ncbi:hypothetical protein Cni_G25288 [Canna indica]|uniref:Dof zinc finger protein n=1 Tax=Canna indica TaxID=4628 RepID=A0AAQ3QPB2_9LILI|nr:hypothetical protein Cni_G25288 [Canna indica]
MVFPSVPVYLDPPNWNQQQAHHHHHQQQQQQQGSSSSFGGGAEASQLPPVGLAAPRPDGAMAGSIRPGSMADRARFAKIPQPEPGLKCPRCDSTNTKFCYFNNYSLSQPRHFCKTCRRYWTRGGALRNVPVGGGCRRNKRTKSGGAGSSASKSASTTTNQTGGGASSSSSTATSAGVGGAIASHSVALPSQFPFMPSLHPLPDFAATNFGMSFSGIQPVDTLDYQLGSGSGTAGIGLENLRLHQMQQFPLLGGALDLPQTPQPPPPPVSGLYSFVGGESGAFMGGSFAGQVPTKPSGSGLITQMASVKMEENNQQLLNFPRQYLGISRNDQFWSSTGSGSGGGGSSSGTGGWSTDLSGFNSSSGNIL